MVSIHRPLGYEPNALPLRHFASALVLKMVRRPGIEPGPPAWKAGILTTELTTLSVNIWIKNGDWGGVRTHASEETGA